MATSFINDPKHWRKCAEEARTPTNQMNDETSKQTMLNIAADYDRLAERAEWRTIGAPSDRARGRHRPFRNDVVPQK
jgi:hypothetical protein